MKYQYRYAPLTHPLQLNHYCQNHIGARAEMRRKRKKLRQKCLREDMLMFLYLKSRETRIILFKSHSFYCVPNWRLCKLFAREEMRGYSKWEDISLH